MRRHATPPQRSRRTIVRALAAPLAVVGTLALGLPLAGCGMSPQNRGMQLRESVMAYNNAIRWGQAERAAEFLPERERAAFLAAKRAAQAGMVVHDIEVRGVQMGPDSTTARVRVAVQFSHSGNPVLQQHLVDQRWAWQRDGWLLIERRQVALPTAGPAVDPHDLY